MTAVLRAEGLCKSFGALKVAREVTLSLDAGARAALIGPNGAGKTTLINLLTGVLEIESGRILLDGGDITRLPQAARVRRGLVRTFQVNSLFPDLSPLEATSLAVLQHQHKGATWLGGNARHRAALEEAGALLGQLGLGDVAERPTRSLAYGQQRLLEIALALALRPRVLLLDEPMAGVPESETAALSDMLAALPSEIAILFIEHDMQVVRRFATHVTVLVAGGVLTDGPPEQVLRDQRVRDVYLGEATA